MEPTGKEIIIIDDDGKESKMEILFTYKNEERKADYVLYFDPAKQDQIFAARYEGDRLIGITDDEEWDEIEEVLDSYQDDPKINGQE